MSQTVAKILVTITLDSPPGSVQSNEDLAAAMQSIKNVAWFETQRLNRTGRVTVTGPAAGLIPSLGQLTPTEGGQ